MTDRILSHLLGIKAFITLFNLTPLRNYLWGEGWRNCSAVKRMCCFFRELVSSTHVRQPPVSLVLPYSSPSFGLWTQHEFYYLQKYGRGFTYRSRNISKTAMAKSPCQQGWQLIKAETMEHTTQPISSSTDWRVSFQVPQLASALPGCSTGVFFSQAAYLAWESSL